MTALYLGIAILTLLSVAFITSRRRRRRDRGMDDYYHARTKL